MVSTSLLILPIVTVQLTITHPPLVNTKPTRTSELLNWITSCDVTLGLIRSIKTVILTVTLPA